jgi:hypothetical protein
LFQIARGSGATLTPQKKDSEPARKEDHLKVFLLQKNSDKIYKEPEDEEQERL